MNQLPPQLLALLAPQMRRPTVYGAQPYQMPQMGQDGAQGAQEAIARAQQADAPQTPPPSLAGAPRPGQRPSHGRRILDRILGGQTLTQAQDAADAEEAGRARNEHISQLASSIEMAPEERLLFEADPETWYKVAGSRLETRVLRGGDVVGDASGYNYAVPRTGMDGGVPFSQDVISGDTTYGTPRPLGPNEQAQADYRAQQATIAQARLEEAQRHNRAGEGVAQSRLGVAQGNLAARRSGKGRGSPRPGAPSAPGPRAAPPPPPGYVPVR